MANDRLSVPEKTDASSRPAERNDGSRDPATTERNRQGIANFRDMTQSERLQDKRTNPGAKAVAALDAAIDKKYGANSPQAARMRQAGREAVAQTIEWGQTVRTPRAREPERARDPADLQRADQDRGDNRSDRER